MHHRHENVHDHDLDHRDHPAPPHDAMHRAALRTARRRTQGLTLAGTGSTAMAQPAPTGPPLAKVSSGRIERLSHFASRHVEARHVDVRLPAGYDAGRRHQVIDLHDGQMLFDAGTTWNRKSRDLSGAMSRRTPNDELPRAACAYLREHLAPAAGQRLYMDHGDQGLDAGYAPCQAQVDQIVAARVHHPLQFLLQPRAEMS